MKARIIGFVLISITGFVFAFFMITGNKTLKIYSPYELNSELVDSSLQSKMSGHRIGSFNLINQYGEIITEKDFENKIYVADFIFTTCPGICPVMTKQMVRVQNANIDQQDFRILSHTVQPDVDTPELLLEYANLYEADPTIWQFVTGDRIDIFNLARKAYFAASVEPGHEEEMVHTENFVLIDKEKRIRGIYDGTSIEEVDRLIDDIEILRNSYE